MTAPYLIKDATVVSDGRTEQLDVRIEGGRIVEVGAGLTAAADTVFTATGLHMLPGLIDDQVHFREPGMNHKAEIATESAAAVAGGVTSYLEMPNTNPTTTTHQRLEEKLARASQVSAANYGFYLGASGNNDDEVAAAAETPACGIKVFLGASTGDLLVHEQDRLEAVFAAVPPGMVLAAHCEDHQRIVERTEQFLQEHNGDIALELHPQVRDGEACWLATTQAIELAGKHDTRLHVLHLTTARELELFTPGSLADKQITAEACVHHLMFTDADYAELGGLIKCNPAIKTAHDRAALRAALRSGHIDVIATDHAPHLRTEKEGSYTEVAAGLPLVEHSLLVLLELVAEGVLNLPQVSQLGAHNPAQLFGITDRGHIRIGCYADLVLVDLNASTTPTDARVRSKCGWTPFAGHEFPARIEAVWVSGRLAFAAGEIQPGTGMQLEYHRS